MRNEMTEQNVNMEARPKVVVQIYVADHCRTCDYAWEVAAAIRSQFPQVELHVIRLGEEGASIPEEVFATPTYLLNGRVWSLGNPSPEEVVTRLSQALADLDVEP